MRIWREATALAAAVAVTYLVWSPPTPDFAAQTAWATLLRQSGEVPLFARWFGGVSVGSYSLLVPVLTGTASVTVVGAASALASILLVVPLLRWSRHPRLALVVFSICTAGNLLSGRVTFAVGVTLGIAVLVAVSRRQTAAALLLAVLTYAASPVAGVLLLVPIGAVLLDDRPRRRVSVAAGVGVLGAAALSHWLFPLPGYEPFDRRLMIVCLVVQLAVAAAPVGRRVRLAAVIGALLVVAAYVVHTPLGGNVARLSVVLMPAAAAAEFVTRRATAYVGAALLVVYPIGQAAGDVAAAADRSARPSFTTALLQQLNVVPAAKTQRVEVVDAATHWGSVRLADAGFSVSRGWLTQLDEEQNPEFYGHQTLTAQRYRVFLDQTATGYVALERSASLDSASVAEAALIRDGLPYLTQIWSDSDWTLYQVSDPAPIATGVAHVVRTTNTGVILEATQPGRVQLDINWSPYLTVTGGTIIRDDSHVVARLSSAGAHTVSASWK